jgi:integrase
MTGELSFTVPTKEAAHRLGTQMEAKMLEDSFQPRSATHTIGEAISRYMKRIAPSRLSASTIGGYESALRWWDNYMGSLRLSAVKPTDIREAVEQLAETHKIGTVNQMMSCLSSVFEVAIDEWEWTNMNPVRRVKRPKFDNRRTRYLTRDDIRHLLQKSRLVDINMHHFIMCAISTGARKGEIEALTWGDVAEDFRSITFHKTKNGESRSVPVSWQLRNVLIERFNALQALARGISAIKFEEDDEYIFVDSALSNIPVFKPFVRSQWTKIVGKLDIAHLTFHDLRHTVASLLAKDGVDTATIAELLGHKSLNTTKRYMHLNTADLARKTERILSFPVDK